MALLHFSLIKANAKIVNATQRWEQSLFAKNSTQTNDPTEREIQETSKGTFKSVTARVIFCEDKDLYFHDKPASFLKIWEVLDNSFMKVFEKRI